MNNSQFVAAVVAKFGCVPPANIEYLGSGVYSDVFKLRYGRRSYILKVSYYDQDTMKRVLRSIRAGQPAQALAHLMGDSISISNKFSVVAAHLVRSGACPHFVTQLGNHNCRGFGSKLQRHMPAAARDFDGLRSALPLQLRYNNVSFWDFWDTDVSRFLRSARRIDDATLASIVLQVAFTLAVLQLNIDNFRHNDLLTNNVLLRLGGAAERCTEYVMGPHRFYTSASAVAAISDYDFLHAGRVRVHPTVDGVSLHNSRVVTFGAGPPYFIGPAPNPSYDMHLFLDSMLADIRKSGRLSQVPATAKFLASVVRKTPAGRLEVVDPALIPTALVSHPFFNVLRSRPPRCAVAGTYRLVSLRERKS